MMSCVMFDVALGIDCGWDVEIEGEGEKERTSLRLNVIIYEPRKKIKIAPHLHGR